MVCVLYITRFHETVQTKKCKFMEISKIDITGESKGHLVVLKICKIYKFYLLLF